MMFHTRDVARDLGAREVFIRHKNNIRGERLTSDTIDISFDAIAHWFVIDINNQSNTNQWAIDLGDTLDGRQGFVSAMLVYEGQSKQTILDALPRSNGTKKQSAVGRYIPITIPEGRHVTLVIYISPNDHAPVSFSPHLVATSQIIKNSGAALPSFANGITMLCFGTALFFFVAMATKRGMGLFPYALFFLVHGAWLWLSNNMFVISLQGIDHLPGIFMVLASLIGLAVTQSVRSMEDSEIGDSILLYVWACFIILLLMVFVFLIEQNNPIRLFVVYGTALSAWGIALYKAARAPAHIRWVSVPVSCAWVIMIAATLLPILSGKGYLPSSSAMLHALWYAMPLVCVLLIIAGNAYLRLVQRDMIRTVLLRSQRAQALSKLRQTKEHSDQVRLLSVIDREREIMEELRNRDAERAEEMRKARIQADEANRAKSAFLAIVSHEIRTPMTGIMGMVRLLLDTSLNREQKEFAQTIEESGGSMLALLNDILDFSKIENGRMDLEMIDFDIYRLINSIVALMSGHAQQKNIGLTANISPDLPRYLLGDPTRLRQILLNLVGNAIKFTPQGHVTISAYTDIHATHGETEAPIIIEVSDTGIGISEEAQAHLFSPFSQADSSIARKFGGTGLGLTICKKLVEAMHGQITLKSTEGLGTTFTVVLSLPIGHADALADAQNQDAANQQTATPLHVLIVDDNAINRKVLEGFMTRDGHTSHAVASAEEAIELIAHTGFDLILMDIEMPGMDGATASRMLKASPNPRIAGTPIIALTGNTTAEAHASHLDAGMVDTVTKPIDPQRLRKIMGRIEAGHSKMAHVSAPDNAEQPALSGLHILTHNVATQSGTPEATLIAFPDHGPRFESQIHDDKMASLFNLSTLETLLSSVGPKPLIEMMEGVFVHNREILAIVQQAYNDEDSQSLQARAHELRGMNGNFGLSEISRLCGDIENTCRNGQAYLGSMDDMIYEILPQAMEDSSALFKQWVETLKPASTQN